MEEKNKTEFKAQQNVKPLSTDELKQKLNELATERQQLINRLRQADSYIENMQTQNLFSYISFLFKVMEHAEMYSAEFVDACVADVQDLMGRLHNLLVAVPQEESSDNDRAQAE